MTQVSCTFTDNGRLVVRPPFPCPTVSLALALSLSRARALSRSLSHTNTLSLSRVASTSMSNGLSCHRFLSPARERAVYLMRARKWARFLSLLCGSRALSPTLALFRVASYPAPDGFSLTHALFLSRSRALALSRILVLSLSRSLLPTPPLPHPPSLPFTHTCTHTLSPRLLMRACGCAFALSLPHIHTHTHTHTHTGRGY